MFGLFKKYEMSIVDLEVISLLKEEEIDLTELKEINARNNNEGYVLKKGCITELRIYDRKLDENILNMLSKLTMLEILDLKSNQIKIIPKSFSNLIHLKILRLQENKITSIPDTLCELIHLERLVLYLNQITIIPNSLGLLTNLVFMDLSSNQIKTIPDTFTSFSNLDKSDGISLGNNKFEVDESIISS